MIRPEWIVRAIMIGLGWLTAWSRDRKSVV